MTDKGEHLSSPNTPVPHKPPWPTPEDALAERKSLLRTSDQPEDPHNHERRNTFDAMLGKLPECDPTFAVELYSLLATDESETLRQQVALHVHDLYIQDKEAGEVLFTRLVNDFDSPIVQNSAFASVEQAGYKGLIPYKEYKALREEYYDACDRAAIREGMLKPKLITASQKPWEAQISPWLASAETAVSYIADLEAKQRNARETAALEDFYNELHYLPNQNPSLAAELLALLAVHENREIRVRVPVYCAYFLYKYNPAAAISIANVLQQDQDYTIAKNVKQFFAHAASLQGFDLDEVMHLLNIPTQHSEPSKPTLTLIQGGGAT